jgi:hypothetical protein
MAHERSSEIGSIIFYILIGIILLGTLTIALRNIGSGGADNIDRETLILKATQVQRYGAELANAVKDLQTNQVSEADIRFAYPTAPTDYGDITTTPTYQVFDAKGGRATYRTPPDGVNDGSSWEFFATTDVPQVGSDKAELIAVLPHVTQAFCNVINTQLGFTVGTQPTDDVNGSSPDCVMGASSQRFTGSFSDSSPNTLDDATFSRLPALQACVYCAAGATYNYYYVLQAR